MCVGVYIYISFVAHLDYSDSNNFHQKIESIQYDAVLVIPGAV